MDLRERAGAESFGTFWLACGGRGSAVLAAGDPRPGIGFLGVSLASGLTVFTTACALGHVPGCHPDPAVTLGLVVGKRFPGKGFLPGAIRRLLGAVAAAAALYIIASGRPGFSLDGGSPATATGSPPRPLPRPPGRAPGRRPKF